MAPNINPSKMFPSLGNVPPQSVAKLATPDTGWLLVPVGSTKWIFINLLFGALTGAALTVTALQAKDSGGTGSKALALKAAVASGGVDNKQVQGEISVDDMDLNNGFTYIKVVLTNDNVAAVLAAVDVMSGPAPYAA